LPIDANTWSGASGRPTGRSASPGSADVPAVGGRLDDAELVGVADRHPDAGHRDPGAESMCCCDHLRGSIR
jgi:hypothetical protein